MKKLTNKISSKQTMNLHALMEAISENNFETVAQLTKNGVYCEWNFYITTPLTHAVRCKRYEIVTLLIERGAFVNEFDLCRITPLGYAVKNLDQKMVNLLVQNGADINAVSPTGWTCLAYESYMKNNNKRVKFAIKNGADVDKGKELSIPILTAIVYGRVNVAKTLIKANANLYDITENGKNGIACCCIP